MRVVPFALVCSVLSAACSSKQAAPPAPQPPAAPAGLAATGGSAQISLTWTAVSGATSYIVLRGDSAGAEAALTPPATSATASYTDAGLAAGKTYFYLVQAVNNAGASASSNEASATTAPPAPAGLAAAGGSGQISLTWAAAPGATSYLILRGDAAGAEAVLAPPATSTAAAYTDTGLAAGKSYFYVVQAANNAGTSASSNESSATTAPPAPAGLSASGGNGQIALTWTAAPGATSYLILRGDAAGTEVALTPPATSTAAAYTDTGLTAGKTYFYLVQAANSAGMSASSNESSATTAPPAPAGLSASGGNGQISLTWTAAPGATSYTILRGDTAGAEVALTPAASSAAAAYTDTGLPAAKTYFYVVEAINSAGASAASNEASATTLPPPLTGLTATGGTGQVTLTWTGVAGATGYSLSRGIVSGGPYTEIATPSIASYTDSAVLGGTTYYYVVQEITPQGKTDKSSEASALTAPDTPAGLGVTTTDTSAILQWTASPGATDYAILRAPGGTTSFVPAGTSTAASAIDSGLAPNTSYVYEVHAHNASGTSANATVNATTAPAAPAGVTASASNHHVTLGWTAAGAGTTGYRVLRSTSAAGPFSPAGTTLVTSFTDKLLTNNTSYYYVVHSMGGSGESRDGNIANATPFIEICTVDGASDRVAVFDGTMNGNVAPKRSFGWTTGIAQGTGIGTDGTNIYIASQYTQTVNIYPRTVNGDTPPTTTITLPGQPTALTVDAANSEIYVAIGSNILVYATSDSGAATPTRTLTSTGTITGLQAYRSASVNELFVLSNNNILVYGIAASGNTAPLKTVTPANTNSSTRLAGPAYDPTDNAVFVGWTDTSNGASDFASFSVAANSTSQAPVRTPISGSADSSYLGLKGVPGGVLLDGSNLWVTSGGVDIGHTAILQYARTASATDSGNPNAGFGGAITAIYKPGALVLDNINGELWFINGKNGAAAYSKTSTTFTSAPVRALKGDSTGVYDPANIAADRVAGEIVVLSQNWGHAIEVYPRLAADPVTPARSVAGNTTTLDSMSPRFLDVDEANGEYWVDDLGANLVAAFPATPGGNVPPARQIYRDASLGNIQQMYYDATAGQICGTSFLVAGNYYASCWNRTDSGPVAADRSGTLTSNTAFSPAVDLVHDLLFMFTDAGLGVFPRAFASGPLTPANSFNAAGVPGNLGAVDGEGDELYFWNGTQIVVTPRPTAGALSVSRTISGSATNLYNTVGLTICN